MNTRHRKIAAAVLGLALAALLALAPMAEAMRAAWPSGRKSVTVINATGIAAGGTGWRTGTIAVSPSVVLANTRLHFPQEMVLNPAGTVLAEGFYCYLSAVDTLTWRGYFNSTATTFDIHAVLEEFWSPQGIQRGQTVSFPGSSSGLLTQDVTVSSVGDYTKCAVNLLNRGRVINGEANANYVIHALVGVMTSNTNLRLTGYATKAGSADFTVSWEIYPLLSVE